mmetsp:Transcript_27147/g.65294  ORF Transcript_27147/g.65294 Transcript_27147/m.65294 type:complete len:211 (-) Transcript_27147:472-1104(-)
MAFINATPLLRQCTMEPTSSSNMVSFPQTPQLSKADRNLQRANSAWKSSTVSESRRAKRVDTADLRGILTQFAKKRLGCRSCRISNEASKLRTLAGLKSAVAQNSSWMQDFLRPIQQFLHSDASINEGLTRSQHVGATTQHCPTINLPTLKSLLMSAAEIYLTPTPTSHFSQLILCTRYRPDEYRASHTTESHFTLHTVLARKAFPNRLR